MFIPSRFKVLHKVSKYIKHMYNYIHDERKTKSRVYTSYDASKLAFAFARVHSTIIAIHSTIIAIHNTIR